MSKIGASTKEKFLEARLTPEWHAAKDAYEKDPTLKNERAMIGEFTDYVGYKLIGKYADVVGTNVKKLPKDVRKMKLGMCFMNATKIAWRGKYTYVEGYATKNGLIPMEHAWLLDEETGAIIDPTWPDTVNEYAGIKIDEDTLNSELLRIKHYGVIFTNRGLNLELIKERWPDVLPERMRVKEEA